MEKVMSKIGKTAVKTYRYAAQGAGKIAREIKLKAQMSEDKEQIRNLYETIGKDVYEKYVLKENLEVESDFADDCAMIDVLAGEIEDIRMELLSLKDLKQCPKCHYEIELDFSYCPNCGTVQELREEAKQNDGPATIETTDKEDSRLKEENSEKAQEIQKENKYEEQEDDE